MGSKVVRCFIIELSLEEKNVFREVYSDLDVVFMIPADGEDLSP